MGCLKLNYYREQAPFFVKVEKPDKEGSKECMQGWLSVDPLAGKLPSLSPYAYCYNNPIAFFDPNGEYGFPTDKIEQYRKDYPHLMQYLETQVKSDVENSPALLSAFLQVTNNHFSKDLVMEAVSPGSGPDIAFEDNPPGLTFADDKGFHGYYDQLSNTISLSASDAKRVDEYLKSNNSQDDKLATFLPWFMTLMHETAEYGNSVPLSPTFEKYDKSGMDPGRRLESIIYGQFPWIYDAYGDPKTNDRANKWNGTTSRYIMIQQKQMDTSTLPTLP